MARKQRGRSRSSGGNRQPVSARKNRTRSISILDADDRSFEARNRALHAIARMRREGISLSQAAREEHVAPETVLKYLPAALLRSKSGQWIATRSDRYTRLIWLPSPSGFVPVLARGSEEAKLASAYLASLTRWAKTEKPYELASFHGKRIGGYELLTASRALIPLRDAGLLQLDSLYASIKDVAA